MTAPGSLRYLQEDLPFFGVTGVTTSRIARKQEVDPEVARVVLEAGLQDLECVARALAVAAVRETLEETGLMLAAPGSVGSVAGPAWDAMRSHGRAPDLARLRYLGRAITPAGSPIRFHARFFLARADELDGPLDGDGELQDLDWFSLEQASRLPLIDVTQFMIALAHDRMTGSNAFPPGRPRFSVRGGNVAIRYL